MLLNSQEPFPKKVPCTTDIYFAGEDAEPLRGTARVYGSPELAPTKTYIDT